MKNLVILIILIGLGYFAYGAFNNSETANGIPTIVEMAGQSELEDLTSELSPSQQEALGDLNNSIKASVSEVRKAIEKAQEHLGARVDEITVD